MAVYDTAQPVVLHADEDFDCLSSSCPGRSWDATVNAKISRLTAVRIPGHAGLPRLAARFFCGTAAGLADGSIDHEDTDLAEHVIDLVRRLYLDLEAAAGNHPRSRRDLVLQAKAYIQAHLGDPASQPRAGRPRLLRLHSLPRTACSPRRSGTVAGVDPLRAAGAVPA